MDKYAFYQQLQNEPIINSHSHHLSDNDHHTLSLESLLRSSYVNWCGVPIPCLNDKEKVEKWLRAVRTRSYFVWLEKALMDIYDIVQPLTADSLQIYDRVIRHAHQNKEWHLRLLRDKCGYRSIWLDTYWSPGEDNSHPELFKPVYRINSFFYGFNQTAEDHNSSNILRMVNRKITDIDEYVDCIFGVMREKKQAGCTAFKCALAYDRSLNFGQATKEQAQRAMRINPSQADINMFQDYLMDCICIEAATLNMPIQIHTGLGLMTGSNAMQLQPLIARNPDTTFLLMHGSYPWISDIAGLAHAYSNVWADLCWLPLISPAAACRLLHELIDVCDADRIVWGCDTWTGEESYGARLALLHVLSCVLTERVESGLMLEKQAVHFAKGVMHDNALRLLI